MSNTGLEATISSIHWESVCRIGGRGKILCAAIVLTQAIVFSRSIGYLLEEIVFITCSISWLLVMFSMVNNFAAAVLTLIGHSALMGDSIALL
jgi:hypothetical protein